MIDCTCPTDVADADNPPRDQALDITFLSELSAAVMFRLHRSLVYLWAVSFVATLIGYVPLKLAHIEPFWIITALTGSGAMTLWTVVTAHMIYRRPASPSYVLAALRTLRPDRRRECLDALNTVSLRGQHTPFTQADVLAATRQAQDRRKKRLQANEARSRRSARVQASLIDAFRG